ncbi:MAG: hypothetical protein H7195_04840, partial [Chryseobacterium sp.]|nr:hypothetical protein [Chryseobacterium sp.]
MAISTLEKNKHLLSRAGFGISFSQISDLHKRDTKELWKSLIDAKRISPLEVVSNNEDPDYATIAKMNP